jgi:AraC-like DNA-binding protein
MSFTTYIPCDILKPFVKTIAISENELASSYKVLPDTSIVMGFQYSGKLSYSKDNTKSIPLSAAGITGLMDTYRVFNNSENISTVLVMFSETGSANFFNQGMHEIFGQSISLDDLILQSQMDVIAEQLGEAKTDMERIDAVEKFLIARLKHKINDELVNMAVSLIKQYAGNIKINFLAEKLNISQGQFEKRFRKTVGASPKKFASIVRLKHILNTPSPLENNLTELGLDAGYFDQAHFIKDFKSFTGETPEQFFKKK